MNKLQVARSLTAGIITIGGALVTGAQADSFGTGGDAFTMDFRNIGNAGNAADDTSYGSVGYSYRMGTNEVSQGMISSYNNLRGAAPAISFFDLSSNGGNGANRAASAVSWNEAARFVNWLNTSSGHSAAYQFDTGGANDNIALWESGDAGYDASNPFRNSNAHYFLPSENEMYKAAYYDPDKSGGAGYWNYATGSDTAPTATSGGTAADTAVYGQSFATGPADVDNAGGLSAYGTMGQGGNVWEWSESGSTAPNDSEAELRVIRGGSWGYSSNGLQSSFRSDVSPGGEGSGVGFRVAVVPEPSSVTLLGLGAISLLMRRKRV